MDTQDTKSASLQRQRDASLQAAGPSAGQRKDCGVFPLGIFEQVRHQYAEAADKRRDNGRIPQRLVSFVIRFAARFPPKGLVCF